MTYIRAVSHIWYVSMGEEEFGSMCKRNDMGKTAKGIDDGVAKGLKRSAAPEIVWKCTGDDIVKSVL